MKQLINRNLKRAKSIFFSHIFFVVVFCGSFSGAFSQTTPKAITEQKLGKTQTVSWEYDPYAFYYNVEIEKINKGNQDTVSVFSGQTQENFVEMPLKLGMYRYRVNAVNLLGKIEAASDWSYFSVVKAIIPEIQSLNSDLAAPDDKGLITIELSGVNFAQGAKIFLQYVPPPKTSVKLIPRGINPENAAIAKDGRSAEAAFSAENLETGDYEVFLQNPDGFFSSYQYVTVSLSRSAESARKAKTGSGGRYKVITEVAAAIPYTSPFIPFYGDAYNSYFQSGISFQGEKMRFDVIPFGTSFGYAGFEIEPFWFLTKAETTRYTVQGHSLGALLNAIFKFPIYKNMLQVNVRFGVGYAAYINMYFDAKLFSDVMHDKITVGFPCGDGGISLQYFPLQKYRFFLDLGVDYIHLFAEGMPIGFLMTGVSVGYSW